MREEGRSDGEYSRRGVLSALGAIPLVGLPGERSAPEVRPDVSAGSATTRAASDTPPPTVWNRMYVREQLARLCSVTEASDGGYLAAGATSAPDVNDLDGLLVKTAADGTEEWTETYGGSADNELFSVIETSDGGYLAAGKSAIDGWLLKMAPDGTEKWNKTFVPSDDVAGSVFYSLIETSDGEYLAAGKMRDAIEGVWNGWLLKAGTDGTEGWSRAYGGRETGVDLFALIETSDGGYVAAGRSMTAEDKTFNGWLMKTAADGTEEWTRTYGGDEHDGLSAVTETSDGGYLAAGTKPLLVGHERDGWLVKTAADGTEEWTRTYDGRADGERADVLSAVVETDDGGYLAAGGSYASTDDLFEGWLLKTAADGTEEWTRTLGRRDRYDKLFGLIETSDGGYVAAGEKGSFEAGNTHGWLVKIGGEENEDGGENPPPVRGDAPPTDPDGDGLYEDLNGDGNATPGDATVLFNSVFEEDSAVTENVPLYDFNGDGSLTSGDATALFEEIF